MHKSLRNVPDPEERRIERVDALAHVLDGTLRRRCVANVNSRCAGYFAAHGFEPSMQPAAEIVHSPLWNAHEPVDIETPAAVLDGPDKARGSRLALAFAGEPLAEMIVAQLLELPANQVVRAGGASEIKGDELV